MARYESYGEFDVKYVDDLDSTFVGFNNRARPDSLAPGILQESQNFRFQREGVAQVRKGIKSINQPLTLSDNQAFTLPFYAYGDPNDSTTTSNNLSTSSVLVVTAAIYLNFATDHYVEDNTRIFVEAIPGLSDFVAGNYKANVTTSTQLYIEPGLGTITDTPTGQTAIGAQELQDSIITAVYGSCVFEAPDTTKTKYVIIAGNTKAVAVNIQLLEGKNRSGIDPETEITYDSGAIQIGESCELIQAFNRVFLFREGKTPLEWNGDLSGSPNFTKVPNGAFTQPVLLNDSSNTTITNGKVVVTHAAGHGLDNGDTVVIIEKGSSGLTVGDTYRVNKDSDTQFHFFADVSNLSSHSLEYMKRVPGGDGYTHMPASEYGVFHNDRMVLPYTFNDATTPVNRGIIDEVIFSQVEQPSVYDPVFGTSRLTQGGPDNVQGIFSFTEDKLLVFMRNSVYSFSNTTDLRNMTKTLLTSEIGLVARRSIVQVGNQILFLSDNGVYGLSFIDLYNLRGNDKPLSEPIQTTIDNIDTDFWEKSIAVYHNNRYYIAVPTKDSYGSVNTILIYNFLNSQWESIDTVADTDATGDNVRWDIENLLVVGDGQARGVYAINELGAIHRLESEDNVDYDQITSQIGGGKKRVDIQGKLRTRQFNFKDIQRKKWNTFEVQLESDSKLESDINITFTTENADDVIDLGSLSSNAFLGSTLGRGDDVSIRGRIGNRRAYGCDCTIETTMGKPKIKVIKVTGGLSFNSTQEIT